MKKLFFERSEKNMLRLFFERSEKNMLRLFSNKVFGPFIIGFLVFLFFLPKLILGKVPIPADSLLGLYHPFRDRSFEGYAPGRFPTKNPLITDPVLQTYPWRYLAVSNLKEGNLPLWNPYSFSGQPLLANIQSSPFQIANLLFFIFPFKIAWPLQVILTAIATGIFMFSFLRSLKLSMAASVFGAVVLPFSGFFIAWQQWGTVTTTAMWLPLILLSINKLFSKKSSLWFWVLILAVSQTIFSGHWQTALYVLFASFLYLIYQIHHLSDFKTSALVLVGLILGLLVSAPQTLPSLEFIKLSARDVDQGYFQGRQDWFLPAKHLVQLIAPDFFGNPATYNYWGVWNYAEFVSFVGIIPLGLVVIALFKRNTQKSFFTLLAIFALVIVLENPLSKIPYDNHWPFLGSIQPSRIIFLLVFSLASLAAFGFDYFLKEKTKKSFLSAVILVLGLSLLLIYTVFFQESSPQFEFNTARVALRNLIFPILTAFIFVVIVLVNYLRFSKNLVLIFIFIAVLVELFRFAYKFSPFSKLSWIFPQTQTTTFLGNQKKPFRIIATDRRIFNGNTPSAYRQEAVHGYDPLYLADYGDLVSSWESAKPVKGGSFNRIVTPQKYDSKIANFLNIKYILTFDEIANLNFEKVFQEGETKVYKNNRALPRAFFVEKVVKVENRNAQLQKLLDANFDLGKNAVSADFEFSTGSKNDQITFQEYTDQSFKIKTVVQTDAPLVISNVFYPGWQATIDGKQTEIKRVNYMFQSIIVPEGTHQLEFKFRPQSFYNGLYLSGIAVALSLFLGIFLWRTKSR